MPEQRREEIRSCLKAFLSERPQKLKEKGEEIHYALFFQSYFSLVFEEKAGQEFTFQCLYDRVEKGRFQWEFYMEWQRSFSHFLYLMTGRKETFQLFDFLETPRQEAEKRSLERYLRKEIKRLWMLALKKGEEKTYLDEFLSLYFEEEEEKGDCPNTLAKVIAAILIHDREEGKRQLLLYGSGSGQLPFWLKQYQSEILIEADESDDRRNALAELLYFALEPEKEWVTRPQENGMIELGISMWPFGMPGEKEEGDFLPASCIPSQKNGLKLLGKWLSKLSAQGIFYFLCPAGFLYREGREKNLRRYLIEDKNLLESIFLFPFELWKSGLPKMALLKFQKDRYDRENIFLLDASGENPRKLMELTDVFIKQDEKKGLSVNLTRQQIKGQDMNLNPARYLKQKEISNRMEDGIEDAKARLTQIDARLKEIEKQKKIYELELDIFNKISPSGYL